MRWGLIACLLLSFESCTTTRITGDADADVLLDGTADTNREEIISNWSVVLELHEANMGIEIIEEDANNFVLLTNVWGLGGGEAASPIIKIGRYGDINNVTIPAIKLNSISRGTGSSYIVSGGYYDGIKGDVAFIMKYDEEFNTIWQKEIQNCELTSIVTPNPSGAGGYYVLSGQCLNKLDEDGDAIWKRTVTESVVTDAIGDLTTNMDGDVTALFHAEREILVPVPRFVKDIRIVKFNSMGDEVWSARYGADEEGPFPKCDHLTA